jgi:hypothetical protein
MRIDASDKQSLLFGGFVAFQAGAEPDSAAVGLENKRDARAEVRFSRPLQGCRYGVNTDLVAPVSVPAQVAAAWAGVLSPDEVGRGIRVDRNASRLRPCACEGSLRMLNSFSGHLDRTATF